MNIGEILIGLLIGGGVGGGASYFLQKGRISDIAQRYEQKSVQTRQALEDAETEVREYKAQLSTLSQSEAQAKSELKNLEATYQSHLEQIERTYESQLAQNTNSIPSPDLVAELEQVHAELRDAQNQINIYQAQILELQTATSVQVEPVLDQARISEIEHHHQAELEELKQTYASQLQEIEQHHQAELAEQQQAYSTQIQEIEYAYQNQIIELEKNHQIQIQELEQAYSSQMLELQETEAHHEQPVGLMSENPDEMQQQTQFTEPWDEDFSKNTIVEMPFAEAEEDLAKITSLEELADLTENLPESEPETEEIKAREQAEFFASQTLIGDVDFLESMHSEPAPEPETEEIKAREQAEFFASQTLIGDVDFLESMDLGAKSSPEEVVQETDELEPANLVSEGELDYNQTLIDEMSFLESLQLDEPDQDYESEAFSNSEDLFNLAHSSNEAESYHSSEDTEQSQDLDLFDLFELPKEELEGQPQTNGNHKSEFEAYSFSSDADFFKMLEDENSETENKDLNIEDLFGEDLFHSEWESSPKK